MAKPMDRSFSLSVVIPAFNEAKRIGPTIESILGFSCAGLSIADILVVDDGSTDRTSDIVSSFAGSGRVQITGPRSNMGKGFSVREGMLRTKSDLALFMDADNATKIGEMQNFIPCFDAGSDIVIGSRMLPQSNILRHQPFYRELLDWLFSETAIFATGLNIRDTQCGFKCLTRLAVKEVFARQTVNGWGFDVEVLYIAHKLGFKITESPVSWDNDIHSKVNPLNDGYKMLMSILTTVKQHKGLKKASNRR